MNSPASSRSQNDSDSKKPSWLIRILIGCVAGLSVTTGHLNLASGNLSFDASAIAAEKTRIRWTPSKERGNVKGTLSGGRRGKESSSCSPESEATHLRLLVPEGRDNLTTVTQHPTLSWQVKTQKPTRMQFVLSDMSNPTPVYTQTLDVAATQFVSVKLPNSVALDSDINYRWTVILDCPEGQKTEIYARSFIRKISGESLEHQLNQKSAIAQAAVFAENGIWYDAVARLLPTESTEQEDLSEALTTLLNQALPTQTKASM